MAQARSMRHAPSERRGRPTTPWSTFLTLSCLLLLPAVGLAGSDSETRYPYDPACPWGRLSNGKGVLHRCLSQAEAKRLVTAEKKRSEKSTPSTAAKSSTATKPSTAAPEETKPEKKPLPTSINVALGPIVADTGDITLGRLDAPMDRYQACVVSGGGLSAASAEVVVKFIVQADRVRAEGATVSSFRGVEKATAQCIADVVDRRQVGAITVPMTGAKLTFTITETK